MGGGGFGGGLLRSPEVKLSNKKISIIILWHPLGEGAQREREREGGEIWRENFLVVLIKAL